MIIETGKASPARICRRNEVQRAALVAFERMFYWRVNAVDIFFFLNVSSAPARDAYSEPRKRDRELAFCRNQRRFFLRVSIRASQSSRLNRPRSRYFSLSFHSHSRLFLASVAASVGGRCTWRATVLQSRRKWNHRMRCHYVALVKFSYLICAHNRVLPVDSEVNFKIKKMQTY